MKTILLILTLAVGVTAQSYWEPVASNRTGVFEMYGAEHFEESYITVWMRTSQLQSGEWRRSLKAHVIVDCSAMVTMALRINRANTGYTRKLPDDLRGESFHRLKRGTIGYRAYAAACDRVFGNS